MACRFINELTDLLTLTIIFFHPCSHFYNPTYVWFLFKLFTFTELLLLLRLKPFAQSPLCKYYSITHEAAFDSPTLLSWYSLRLWLRRFDINYYCGSSSSSHVTLLCPHISLAALDSLAALIIFAWYFSSLLNSFNLFHQLVYSRCFVRLKSNRCCGSACSRAIKLVHNVNFNGEVLHEPFVYITSTLTKHELGLQNFPN